MACINLVRNTTRQRVDWEEGTCFLMGLESGKHWKWTEKGTDFVRGVQSGRRGGGKLSNLTNNKGRLALKHNMSS